MADFAMAVAWNANGFILPIHATAQGWSAADVGNLGGAFGLSVCVARAVPAAWRRRLDDWFVIRLALVTAGACFVALPWSSGLGGAFAVQSVLGLGLGGALPSVLSLLHAHAPADRLAEVLGLRVSVLNASYVAWPIVLGGLGAAVGMPLVLWGLGSGLWMSVWAMPAATCRRSAGKQP